MRPTRRVSEAKRLAASLRAALIHHSRPLPVPPELLAGRRASHFDSAPEADVRREARAHVVILAIGD